MRTFHPDLLMGVRDLDGGKSATFDFVLDLGDRVRVERVNWIVPPPPPARVTVRVRHAAADVPATLDLHPDGSVAVEFATPQRAAAPGQAVTFYDDQRVLGGGIIMSETMSETKSGIMNPGG